MIGKETERPYERPPLTKDYLRGESPREKAYVHAEAFYREHDIELMTATAVTALDPDGSLITLDRGGELAYDRLLLTTGAEPRRIRPLGPTWTGSTTCARSRTATLCASVSAREAGQP